jgi:CO dehydrogenase maturation factor
LLRSDDIGHATVIADLEAGLGTLIRMGDTPVDVVLLVVEPSAKSVEVARRAVGLLADRPVGRLVVVANKVAGADDVARLQDALGAVEIVVVPEDARIREADRRGVSPLEHAPDSPAVARLVQLGEELSGSSGR